MSQFISFTKKEFLESIRNYKLFVILVVFMLFGMLNPITAKLLPDILAATFEAEGMVFELPEPTTLDSWAQFYKNSSTLLMIFIVLFSGVLATELSKGTLVNMVTKGLKRSTIIISKFSYVSIMWTLAYYTYFLTTLVYTIYLLPSHIENIWISAFYLWVYGELLIAIMFLGSVILKNIYGAILSTGVFAVALTLLTFVPKVKKVNPLILSSENLNLLSGVSDTSVFFIPLILTLILIIVSLFFSIRLFNKVKL